MRIKLALTIATAGLSARGCSGVGTSRFRRGIRRDQTAQADRHGHQDGVDQPALLDSS